MALNIGSNIISPTQIDNVINNQFNKIVTPIKSQQVITVNDTIFEMPSYFRDGSSTEYKNFNGLGLTSSDTILITGWVGYERSGAITEHWRNINIQTLYTTQTFNYDSSYYIKLDTSRQRLEIHTGEITCYQLNMYKLSNYDGMDQVTIEPIPSDYIIPEGTLTISAPGIIDVRQYASVFVPSRNTHPSIIGNFNASNGLFTAYYNTSIGYEREAWTHKYFSYSSYTVNDKTIIPNESSQIVVEKNKWIQGSIVVEAIPTSIQIYQKIIEKTITLSEFNNFISDKSNIGSYLFIGYSNSSRFSGILDCGIVTDIGMSAFASCRYLTGVYGSQVSHIGSYAFTHCRNISVISFPNLVSFDNMAFSNIYELKSIYLPELTGSRTQFSYCYGVEYINVPKLSELVTGYNFYLLSSLISVSLPELRYMSYCPYMFYGCSSLTFIELPKLSMISGGYSQFYGCKNLQTISLPKLEIIKDAYSMFGNCSQLMSIYLMNSSVVSLNRSDIFAGSSIPFVNSTLTGSFGSFYVPSSLINDYKTHSMWGYYSERFVGI